MELWDRLRLVVTWPVPTYAGHKSGGSVTAGGRRGGTGRVLALASFGHEAGTAKWLSVKLFILKACGVLPPARVRRHASPDRTTNLDQVFKSPCLREKFLIPTLMPPES